MYLSIFFIHCFIHLLIIYSLIFQESNRLYQEKQQGGGDAGDTKPVIDVPQPEVMDFKVKSAEIKSFAKVKSTWLLICLFWMQTLNVYSYLADK